METPRDQARAFLRSRRDRLTPEEAGIPRAGGARRVPGLRRDEVAWLAGISVDYYTRLEKGNLRTASAEVLEALSDALRLDDAERAHLRDLARDARGGAPARADRRADPAPRVPEAVLRMIEAMPTVPALVCDGRLDVLSANPLARALYAPVLDSPTRDGRRHPNLALFRFLDLASRDFYPDWSESARAPVAMLRLQAGRTPRDRELTALIGELSTRSEEFRRLWAAHDVRAHDAGTKHVRHPEVGEMRLAFQALTVDAAPALRLMVYTAAPDSTDAERLALLASWSATQARAADVGV